MEKIPEEDDENFSIEVEGYQFTILRVENRMIQSVLVTRLLPKVKAGDRDGLTEEKNDTYKPE